MAAEYVASYRFIHAARKSRPTKAVSIAKSTNRKNKGGKSSLSLPVMFEDDELLCFCFVVASNIVNASLRKF